MPLTPVPLNGEVAISRNGEFRIKKVESEYGNYVLEMKQIYKDPDWKFGYAFDTKQKEGDIECHASLFLLRKNSFSGFYKFTENNWYKRKCNDKNPIPSGKKMDLKNMVKDRDIN